MFSLPVLLVVGEPTAQLLGPVLAHARVAFRVASAPEALSAVGAGWADVVVCERRPGWSALVEQLEEAGGAALLWGSEPPAEERQGAASLEVEAVEQPGLLGAALERTHARRCARHGAHALGESLLERVQLAERVSQFAQSIATRLALRDVSAEARARACALCDADASSLLLVDVESGELCGEEAPEAPGEGAAARTRLRPGEGVAGKLVHSPVSVLVREVPAGPEGAADGSPGSVIAVPLLFNGEVLGVLQAVRVRGRPPFEPVHLRRLEAIAPHVTIAVHNAQLNALLRDSQTQVLRANTELEAKVRQRSQQLEQGKREWERTFDAISEPIALLEGFTVRRANLAYARRAGVPIQKVPGQACYRLLAGRTSPCEHCPLLRGPGAALSAEVALAPEAIFSFNAFRIEDSPGDERVVVHYRDVSGVRQLEAKLRESERLSALGQLASGAAHEINNPIAFVMSNLRSLRTNLEDLETAARGVEEAHRALTQGKPQQAASALEGADPTEVLSLIQDGLAMVAESLSGATRVADIVRGLRELARLQFDRAEACAVNASAQRVVRTEFGAAAGLVELLLESQALAAIAPLHLDQALGHVLRNARQAIGPGQRVRLRTRDEEGRVCLEVQDEGCGIAPENLRRIFEPFFTTRGVGRGVGLGLTATYGIVQRYGGTIEVDSSPGKGTCVRIYLPRAEASATPTPEPRLPVAATQPAAALPV